MSKPHQLFSISECKIKASILLKELRAADLERSQAAAKRFKRLAEFSKLSIDAICNADIKRKHALAVIALEKGFQSWSELKYQLPLIRGGFLNHWFASYDEAKSFQKANGGYLFPYKSQCFIANEDYLRNLGLDPNDTDWALILFDWVKPANNKAWQRLYRQWIAIVEKDHE